MTKPYTGNRPDKLSRVSPCGFFRCSVFSLVFSLVSWLAYSVSVVPSSKLKYRDGANVVQKWPDRDYRGVILEESGKLHV